MPPTPSPKELAELSRKIFQRLPINHQRTGNKVINKQLKGETVVSWFRKPLAKTIGGDDPYFQLMDQERLLKLDQLKRRGKTVPKKGAGKRASKK